MIRKLILPIILVLSMCIHASAWTTAVVSGDSISAADTSAPTFDSASIAADGLAVTINFNENVTGTENDTFNLDCDGASGADVALTYSSGSGTPALVFTAGETIQGSETCDLDFDGDANDFEDDASNDLADFADAVVTNNSEVGGAACDSITANMWQTFEFSDPADAASWATPLAANDNVADGAWSVVDASNKLAISTDGETALLSCPGAVADTGTRGIAFDVSGGLVAYIRYIPASAKDAVSFGWWYKTPNMTGNTYSNVRMFDVYGTSAMITRIRTNTGGDADNPLIIADVGGDTTGITVANSTWYWITYDFVRNGTCTISVYDTAGALVDSNSGTAVDQPASEWFWGQVDAYSDITTTAYYDDLVADWTDQTFPLGP